MWNSLFETSEEKAAFEKMLHDPWAEWIITELPGTNLVNRMKKKYPWLSDRIHSFWDKNGNARKDISITEKM